MTTATSTTASAQDLVEAHRETLQRAVTETRDRGYWSAFPESPSPRVYGETAADEGKAAFEALLGRDFELDQPGTTTMVGTERSPYGLDLGVRYPHPDLDVLIPAMRAAMPAWRDAGPEVRAAVCIEILRRINAMSFAMAHAVHHTSGQPFVMAFQAGGPHAQDRGLEAVAYAFAEQTRHAAVATWEKPQGKGDPVRMTKEFTTIPRGLALVIGCTTFPTWNSYPGLFASLATGNAVIVKPHPKAILPLALTVRVARQVLSETGFSPDLVCLAAEEPGEGLASVLATRPEVRIVDFTGSTGYGDWLEANARQASVYTEKAGVNNVVIDSTSDFAAMCRNLAFSLSLYSGQMCTTPQNLLVPRDGIATDEGHKSAVEVAKGIADAVSALLADAAKAVELTGAIVNADVLARVEQAPSLGEVVLATRELEHPLWPDAVVRTPTILAIDSSAEDVYTAECFGPVSFVVSTGSSKESVEILRRTVTEKGGISAAVYSTDEGVLEMAREAALDAGIALSENLLSSVFVNQTAAFSDFHATGANPAANACYCDGAFVANRFRTVEIRRHI